MSKWHHSERFPISEETLTAYVDGMLGPQRRLEVESYLARHPEQAARVEAYIQQNRELHQAYDRYLAEPLPESIRQLEQQLRRRMTHHRRERPPRRVVAAVLGAGLIAVVGWWSYQHIIEPSSSDGLFSLLDRDVGGPSEIAPQALIEQASSENGGDSSTQQGAQSGSEAVTAAPDFKSFGFSLIGTRLLQGVGRKGSAMQLIYESQNGARVFLYFSPGSGGNKSRLTLQQEGPISVLFWDNAGRSYGMIGEVGRDTLLAMGKVVNGEWTADLSGGGAADERSGSSDDAGGDGRGQAQPVEGGGAGSAGQVDAKTEAISEPVREPADSASEGGQDGKRPGDNENLKGSEGRDASERSTERIGGTTRARVWRPAPPPGAPPPVGARRGTSGPAPASRSLVVGAPQHDAAAVAASRAYYSGRLV